jgi:hypothetical protein
MKNYVMFNKFNPKVIIGFYKTYHLNCANIHFAMEYADEYLYLGSQNLLMIQAI